MNDIDKNQLSLKNDCVENLIIDLLGIETWSPTEKGAYQEESFDSDNRNASSQSATLSIMTYF